MSGDAENGVLGMYYLGGEDIFAQRDRSHPGLEVFVSFYEIYCGRLFDLLNQRELLQAREDAKQNVNIVGLTTKRVESPREFMEAISCGSAVRITSQNSTNADSSRSHAILQI
jgi:kinesin family member 2/24